VGFININQTSCPLTNTSIQNCCSSFSNLHSINILCSINIPHSISLLHSSSLLHSLDRLKWRSSRSNMSATGIKRVRS